LPRPRLYVSDPLLHNECPPPIYTQVAEVKTKR
jgi:hypothetical protein